MNLEIRAAVRWWSEKLAGPHFQDNGANLRDFVGLYGSLQATMVRQDSPVPSPNQLQAFRIGLAFAIRDAIETQDIWRPYQPIWGGASEGRCISVDYDPDRMLRDCAVKAGISLFRFPIKTTMWLSPGRVTVACGYRAPEEVIYDASVHETSER
jgi:hypothetical protein